MPWRMSKVHERPSGDWVQLVATPGDACRVDLSKFSRRSKLSARTSYSGDSIAFHGLTVRMSLMVPSMNIPPAVPDGAADADAFALALWAQAVPAARITMIIPLSVTKSPLRTFLMVPPSMQLRVAFLRPFYDPGCTPGWSTVNVWASASKVACTPRGIDARCVPWPRGSL